MTILFFNRYYMKKVIGIVACLLLASFSLKAQDEKKSKINSIKKNDKYIYAEATLPTLEGAYALAEEMLHNNINEWAMQTEKMKGNQHLILRNTSEEWNKLDLPRGNMYGVKCTALRFFNVYGVGQNMDNLKQGMASIYLALALKNKHITIKGTKERFRDFVYIDDVVDSVIKSINSEREKIFEAYNVSNARPVCVYEIIDIIEKTLPFKVTHEYIKGTPGDQMGIYGDFSKIEKDLGWRGIITFEEGMKKMIDWAL
jgi:hypothetical protein